MPADDTPATVSFAPTMGGTLWGWLAAGDARDPARDAAMWGRFFDHYAGPFRGWAYSRLRPDRDAAETVAVDVLLKVRRRFLKPKPVRLAESGSLRAYL